METPVQDAPIQDAPVIDAASAVSSDPFALDEAKFASLSPEQRAALDPVFEEWKTKAKGEIEKTSKTYEEKYKPHMEKAQALDNLVKDPRFVQWWNNVANVATGGQGTQGAKPQDFATPEEWQTAVGNAYNGDPTKMQEIQARMFSAMATPVVMELRKNQEELKRGQEEFRTMQEMKDLFERYPDAKQLDSIGRNPSDPNDTSLSLLEMCLNWADENGKSMADGYAMAKKWSDGLRVGAEQKAMGLVQEKKASITSGPSTNKAGQAVVEVADAEELMEKNMEYLASGQTPPRFVIRKTEALTSGNRWSQRT
jgi:hypothetical protein